MPNVSRSNYCVYKADKALWFSVLWIVVLWFIVSYCRGCLCCDSLGCDPLCCGSLCRGSLCRGSLCRGSLCRGSLCRGSLCCGSLCRGSLCRGSLCCGSLCRGYPVVGVRPKPSSRDEKRAMGTRMTPFPSRELDTNLIARAYSLVMVDRRGEKRKVFEHKQKSHLCTKKLK